MKKNLVVLGLIVASITTSLTSTVISYGNAVSAAEDFLKSQALGIAASLDTALSRYGTKDNIFPDMIRSGRWEGIAFLALYDGKGLTVLHSNENLIRKKAEDEDVMRTAESGEPRYGYRKLGTGEDVFVMNVPVHLGGTTLVLRVALHTYPARVIVRGAKFQLLSVLTVVSVLSAITVFFVIAARRREELEKVLAEKEKFSVLGEMASVLAHEIRNPLGSIKGFAQYLREQASRGKAGNGEITDEYLGIIVSESGRIETLTKDLLAYSGQDEVRSEEFSLSELVKETLSLMKVPEYISLVVDAPDDVVLFSDKNKLRQIVTNLLQNALDAIPDTGTIEVRAEKRRADFLLRISDSGTGMDELTIANMFKPFYTTKSKGTGLGLAIVERYVKAIGGKIEVKSEKGKGSAFSLTIPKKMRR